MVINKIIQGDCLIKLKELEDNSVDSIVTDPPYELGFMGKSWDSTGIANNVEMWAECLRVLKPGGHLLAFSGTRTYHRMASAIEDAGFEVRDMIEWVYGSGFPKSLNIAKQLETGAHHSLAKTKVKKTDVDEVNGTEAQPVPDWENNEYGGGNGKCQKCGKWFISGSPCICPKEKIEYKNPEAKQWEGWGTALKPAHEPICMARKPLAEKTVAQNVLKYGTGGINIDESRVGTGAKKWSEPKGGIWNESVDNGATLEDNPLGRFPANLLHDNSEEVRECFPDSGGGKAKHNSEITRKGIAQDGSSFNAETCGFDVNKCQGMANFGDSGNASRFFKSIVYVPKASKSERNNGCEGLEEKQSVGGGGGIGDYLDDVNSASGKYGSEKAPAKNAHPCVKPIALMEYLIKMVTPKGGIVLDPFAGSGSTLVAAKQNGFQYIGIEMTEEYIPIIEARLKAVETKRVESKIKIIK